MHGLPARQPTSLGQVKRYAFLQALASRVTDELVVTNLANTATEWFSVRPSDANLYAVGMGMVTPYALGLALALPGRHVIALDGDGGIFFDPSVFGVMAAQAAANVTAIVFDNGGYVSTGKLPAVGSLSHAGVEIETLARAYGVGQVTTVTDVDGFLAALGAKSEAGPRVIVVKTSVEQQFVGALPMDLKENKYHFARHIEQSQGIRIFKPSAKEHGAKPAADPALRDVGQSGFGQVLYEGLKENGIDFAIGLPCSGFSAAQDLLLKDETFDYVSVPHEGTGLGLCAGAWLAGRRPAALIENFGLFASVYHLLRGHMSYGIPTLIVTEFRGDTGDQEFFAEGGEVTLDVLRAMRVNHRVIERLDDIKPAIRDALRWMDGCLRPFALVPAFNLTRLKS
ncbi:thiamine pyrophosphate-dependent enzyme [Microbacteriaceae bacterium K1510]|nr:thiamine pyrophosphate-dependent enzyme [Microbacteriaceae bacterium K1510]